MHGFAGEQHFGTDRTVGERIPDEPPPIPNEGEPVWELVIRDMRERDHVGRERYGTPLQTFNGRRQLVDAYQESLDQVVYLRAEMAEEAQREFMRLRAAAEGMDLGLIDRVAEALLNAEKHQPGTRSIDPLTWQRLERYQPAYVNELRVRAVEAIAGLPTADARQTVERLFAMPEAGVDSAP